MSNPVRNIGLVSTLLLASCATAPTGPFDDPLGQWKERYKTIGGSIQSGKVNIIDEASGTYSSAGMSGRYEFFAREEPRTWKAYWLTDKGNYSCAKEKGGSVYWGEQIFQFNEAYNQYTGYWNICGEGTKYTTKGTR